MKKIEVLYSDNQRNELESLMCVTGLNKTDMARAAMFLGLKQIRESIDKDRKEASEMVAITAFKAKQ